MATELQALEKFQEYVTKTNDKDCGQNNTDRDEDYAARLNKTLQSLQNQVKQHEAALERVSLSTHLIVSLLCQLM